MADLEYVHAFGNNSTPTASETQDNPAPAPNNNINNNNDPTATENDKNQKDTEQADENFNSFYYWRPPLPDISGELEMLTSPTEEVVGGEEEDDEFLDECPVSKCSPAKATSDQIQKVLDCLQPHMDDPDVQGQYDILLLGHFVNLQPSRTLKQIVAVMSHPFSSMSIVHTHPCHCGPANGICMCEFSPSAGVVSGPQGGPARQPN